MIIVLIIFTCLGFYSTFDFWRDEEIGMFACCLIFDVIIIIAWIGLITGWLK